MRSVRVCRVGMAYHGIKPGGAVCASPLCTKSMRPSASHRRRRVRALITMRVLSKPCQWRAWSSALSHCCGWLPYMSAKNARCVSPRNTVSASCASVMVCSTVHWGKTPAWTISHPCAWTARGQWRNQCSNALRSGACSVSSSVSCRLVGAPVSATASRCRSWLPSRQTALLPMACKRRRVASESGPRFTKSPKAYKVSRLGEKSRVFSRFSKAISQPWISPIM